MLALLICQGFVYSIPIGLAQDTSLATTIINTNTTWTKANSPFVITGHVIITSGATLTIESGTTVNLAGDYIPGEPLSLTVEGTLNAQGTSSDPIVMNGLIKFTKTSSNWDKETGTGSILENVVLSGSIVVDGSSPKIAHSQFTHLSVYDGSPLITGNTLEEISLFRGSPVISNNVVDMIDSSPPVQTVGSPIIINNVIEMGLSLNVTSAVVSNNIINDMFHFVGHESSATISNNYITIPSREDKKTYAPYTYDSRALWLQGENSQINITGNVIRNSCYGIESSMKGSIVIEKNLLFNCTCGIMAYTGMTVENNNFVDCELYTLYVFSQDDVMAANNWWGTTDTQVINEKLKVTVDSGTVTSTPFLTSPNSDAPTVDFNPLTAPLDVSGNPLPASDQTPQQTLSQINPSTQLILEVTIIVLLLVIIGLLIFVTKRSKSRIKPNKTK
jgi:hypothetical protein